jgi:hypothetical protein
MNLPAPGVPGDPLPTRSRRRPPRALPAILAAVCCLAAAIVAGTAAHAEFARKPTPAELSAAAAAAVAVRWRSWPTGRIFPAVLFYTTQLLTHEAARRVGIAPQTACPAGLDAALRGLAAREGCQAVLRATYLDQLEGTVYTIGVVAFASGRGGAAFERGLPRGGSGITGLHALAFPGTASAAFNDAARQTATALQQGPYVLLTTAGYADGRPAKATGQSRGSIFAPAAQLAAGIIGPLTAPAHVDCRSPLWSC